jgi:uncharacterized radical SAM superfamily Fe-S cluster-containing enzyme
MKQTVLTETHLKQQTKGHNMLVDATGSIDILSINFMDGKEANKKEIKEIHNKLKSGDYVLSLKEAKIIAIPDFVDVATFNWQVNNMEYDFDFWEIED